MKKISMLTEILDVVDGIEELDGDIPDEIYNQLHNGTKEEVTAVLRALVIVTKNEIKYKITGVIMKGE